MQEQKQEYMRQALALAQRGAGPNHASAEWHPLAGCTAGRELHPALKNQIFGFAGQSLYCSA